VLRDYKKLTKELTNRFRVVESTKKFVSQFSNRHQKAGESVENYAAELKQLYDRAHSRRDNNTRTEDLVRRFLDGLTTTKLESKWSS
jgi:hypothetical protein